MNNKLIYFKKNKIFTMALVICIIIIVLIIIKIRTTLYNNCVIWENRALPGVYIEGLYVGGMTKDEIIEAVNEEFMPLLREKTINFNIGEKKLVYNYDYISSKYNTKKIAEEAIIYGKNKTYLCEYYLLNKKEKLKDFNLDFTYDKELLLSMEEDIIKITRIEPKDATISISNGGFNIIDEEIGYELNMEALENSLVENLNGSLKENTYINLSLEEIPAKITRKDLEKIKGPMSSFTSYYGFSSDSRCKNIQLATSLVNGTILMSGEEFSYSEVTQKGRGKYESAPGYVGSQVVQVEGGGICQVCTTLYRAIMRCNIKSTERHGHSRPVSYTSPGLDATVAWGGLDYKFVNTYNFPIYIVGSTYGKSVQFTIYGDPEAKEGNSYDLVSEIKGKTVNGYLVTYRDGKIINKELVSKDKVPK